MPARLKSLELVGYKTFASKSQFLFGEKITCIVGPNGSGKSNLADAIRWVLGEQSFTLLRGKKTEDMIFAGSELRPRANVAQATVTFDNADGWLPIDFAEVSIARRAYRDGQNEYLLNGQRARLRDIAELLGQVGLAQRTYTVVGQGLVDTALALSADERRALFEEAAGIGIYRAKRDDALRKLEQTQINLQRVHDILAEIGPRLRTLERQAARARDYNQVKAELDGVLKIWHGYHWHEAQKNLAAARGAAETHAETLGALQREQQELDQTLTDVRAKINALRAQLNMLHRDAANRGAESESLTRRLAVADERVRSLAEQRDVLAAELTPLEADLAAQNERVAQARTELAALEVERDSARGQLETLEAARARREAERRSLADREAEAKNRAATLAAQINERKLRRAQLTAERGRLTTARAELADSLAQVESVVAERYTALVALETSSAAARARYDESEVRLAQLTARIAQAEAELTQINSQSNEAIAAQEKLAARADVLKPLRAGAEGDSSGLAILRRAARENRVALRAELADLLAAPPELDTAIAAALGPLVNAALIDDADSALDLLTESTSRAALVSPQNVRAAPPLGLAVHHPDLIGIACDLVKCDNAHRPLVNALLGRAVLVRTRDAARQVAAALPEGALAVTLDGEIFFASGAILAGRDSSASAIALAREWRDLPAALERAQQRRRSLESQREQLETELRELRAARDSAANALRDLQTAAREAADSLGAARLDLERAEAQAKLRRDQLAALDAQIADSQRADLSLAAELETLAATAAEADQSVRAIALQASELSADDFAQQIAEWQTKAAVAARAAADAHSRTNELQAAAHRAADVAAARRARLESLAKEIEAFLANSAQEREQSSALDQQLAALAAQIEPAERQLTDLEAELAEVENAEAAARANLHSAERYHADAQLDFARKKDELESLQRHVSEDFGLVALEYTDDFTGPTPLPLEGVVEHLPRVETLPEGIEESLNRYRRQLRRMGGYNPEAVNEYKEVKERYEFLTSQVSDLESAAAQLREVIAELDQLMEREFRRTFEAASEQFKDTFGRLFGGGTAKLILTDPDSLTTTGIDILARLPGRKQQGLALLSGGERALTACALIFALLKVNPPPFAMLDEVDAALDEANVGRFRDLLVEMSQRTQFILITHNRHTVQAADTVYGISMGADSVSQAISLKLDGETVANTHTAA